MNDTWIKLYRKVLQSEVWDWPPLHRDVWIWILLSVQYETGILRTSMNRIAQGVSYVHRGVERIPNRRTIQGILSALEGLEMIIVESNRQYTTLTVCNWEAYQNPDEEKVTVNAQVNAQVNAHHTRSTKKYKPKRQAYMSSEQAREIVEAWHLYRPLPEAVDRDVYHKTIDDMHRLDKLDWPDIIAICRHAVMEWGAEHIQTPSKLRKASRAYPELKTWQVIQGQLDKDGQNGTHRRSTAQRETVAEALAKSRAERRTRT